MLKVGIVGVGTIGKAISKAIDQGKVAVRLEAITDLDLEKAIAFASTLKRPPAVVGLDELVERSDLVVEAASREAVAEVVPKALEQGKDILVLTVGGLLGNEDWFQLAEKRGCRIYVPSGAIAGLDGLKAASVGDVRSVTLTSRKPLKALANAAYVVERGITLDALEEETVIFQGSALEACAAFPATTNVAAALSLAGIGPERTTVKVVAVPGGQRNIHEIEIEGELGRIRVSVENVPSEANPRTSKLAYLSAIATLQGIVSPLKVGT